jgi:hypothetical protein
LRGGDLALLDISIKPRGNKIKRSKPQPCFYVFQIGDANLVKFGQTTRVDERAKRFRGETGCTPRLAFQILVKDRADAIKLETRAVKLANEYFERISKKREWFKIPQKELAELCLFLSEAVDANILECRGAPWAGEQEVSLAMQYSHEAFGAGRQRRAKRHKPL